MSPTTYSDIDIRSLYPGLEVWHVAEVAVHVEPCEGQLPEEPTEIREGILEEHLPHGQ
ncbi:hypothetical protein TRAPUB_5343 [Trametes pubescens]|uniref:Uncharacterized protein n=1 Tax=Trametes pubescens TaxID=154538 RepID=A0A1M2V8V7_TRAPU|nr:hypothetical protein TRAPUB_5343 [Trametes pubescens]